MNCRQRHASWLGAVVVATATLTSCGLHSSNGQSPHTGSPTDTGATAASVKSGDSRLHPVPGLPPGYVAIPVLAADIMASGFWVLGEAAHDARLFHYSSAAGSWSSTSLGDPASGDLLTNIQAGLGVDTGGAVWLGVNTTLWKLDQRTGSIAHWPIPSSPTSATLRVPRPAAVRQRVVQDMAISTSGLVALALTGDGAATIFDPATSTFSFRPTASGVEPTALAWLDDGTLGVGSLVGDAQAHPVATRSASGAVVTVTGVGSVAAAGSSVVALAGDSLSVVDAQGHRTAIPPAASSIALAIGSRPAAYAGDRVIAATRSGFAILRRDGSAVTVIDFPESLCGSDAIPGLPGVTRAPDGGYVAPPAHPCPTRPLAFAVDAWGTTWYDATLKGFGELPAV